jgi:hypothetical protein
MAKKKREISNQEYIDIKKIDKTKYEIIELFDKKGIPAKAIWFGNCQQVEQGISEFEKNRTNLKLEKVYFFKEREQVYITYTEIK